MDTKRGSTGLHFLRHSTIGESQSTLTAALREEAEHLLEVADVGELPQEAFLGSPARSSAPTTSPPQQARHPPPLRDPARSMTGSTRARSSTGSNSASGLPSHSHLGGEATSRKPPLLSAWLGDLLLTDDHHASGSRRPEYPAEEEGREDDPCWPVTAAPRL